MDAVRIETYGQENRVAPDKDGLEFGQAMKGDVVGMNETTETKMGK